jgi:queuine/archaeosine tRNA-ribosyltransferase
MQGMRDAIEKQALDEFVREFYQQREKSMPSMA